MRDPDAFIVDLFPRLLPVRRASTAAVDSLDFVATRGSSSDHRALRSSAANSITRACAADALRLAEELGAEVLSVPDLAHPLATSPASSRRPSCRWPAVVDEGSDGLVPG